MRAITLRNVPPAVAREIEERSRELGLSLNKTVIRLLEERLLPARGSPLGSRRYHDLDQLAGAWSAEEAAEFDRVVAEQRTVDEEIWR